MNNSLSEIQADIKRLASQQNQIQHQHLMTHHHQQQQQQQPMHQQQLSQLQSLSQQQLQNYGVMPPINPMTPRLQQEQHHLQQQQQQQSQFYLHDQPQPIQRRTWGRPQQPQQQNLPNEIISVGYHQPIDPRYTSPPSVYQSDPRLYQDTRTWGAPTQQQKGFVLHDDSQEQRYLNGGDHSLCNSQMHQPISNYSSASMFNQTPPASASPQHRNLVSIFYFTRVYIERIRIRPLN